MAGLGDYTEIITFKNPTKTGDTSGGSSEAYNAFVTTRASAVKRDGYREMNSGYDSVIEVYEFACFWRYNLEQNVDKDTRIVFDGKEYRLESWEVVDSGFKLMKFKASCIL